MAVSENVLNLTGRLAPRWMDRALADALATADPADMPVLVDRLLQRSGRIASEALVRHFHMFADPLKQRVVDESAKLAEALRGVGRHGGVQDRLNAVRIIARAGDRAMMDQLNRHLSSSESRVARRAAATMLQWTERHCGQAGADPGPWQEAMGRALVDACRTYARHRWRDVILAACGLCERRPDWLKRFFNPQHDAATKALVCMLDALDEPDVCRLAPVMLRCATLRPAALRALIRPRAQRWIGHWLENPTLLNCFGMRKALAELPRAEHLVPTHKQMAGMKSAALRQLPNWIDQLPLDRRAKLVAMGRISGCSDPSVRLGCLRRLQAMRCGEADALISCLGFDPSPAVARMALRWLLRRRWGGLTRLLTRLVGCHNKPIRRMAAAHLAERSFASLWHNWAVLEQNTRRSAGRAWLKLDRRDRSRLNAKLHADDGGQRFRAVAMVRELGLADRYSAELIERLEDEDAKVVSSAAGALGAARDTPQLDRALRKALDHDDDRVRSNAIESLHRLGRLDRAKPQLWRLVDEGGNRSRATALWAMSEQPTERTMMALTSMLDDPRPSHRLSALWVVGRTRPQAMTQPVMTLAQSESDVDVRAAALRIIRQRRIPLYPDVRVLGEAG